MINRIRSGGCGLGGFYIIFWIVFAIGYVLNIVKLVKADFKEPYKVEVIRTISIVTGIGGIVGWINFDEEKQKKND